MRIDNSDRAHCVMTADSLPDILDWLDATPSPWKRRASLTGSRSFTGSDSMHQACHLARFGWPEGLANMSKGMERAAMLKPAKPVQSLAYDIGGAYPDVAMFCAGVPDHMICPMPEDSQTKPIYRFVIGMFSSAAVAQQSITNRGAAILSFVEMLEAEGARVEIMMALLVRDEGKKISLGFTVKRADEALDLDKLAFAMAHPSTYRRIGFAAMERVGHMENPFCHGYGYSSDAIPAQWDAPNSVYFPGITSNAEGPYAKMPDAMLMIESIIRSAIKQD